MAYIVLAAGAVMVLIGALAIITGYPIIQVERGWATVIAGTTLLAGGIVTMGLALLLRAVMDLRLAMSEHARGTFDSSAGAPMGDRAMEPLFASRAEPAMTDAPPAQETAMLGAVASAVPIDALAPHDAVDQYHVEPHHADEPVHEQETYTAHAAPLADDNAHIDETPVVSTQAVEPPHEIAHEAAPPLDDWLDRAFADLQEPVAPEAPHAEHPTVEQPTFEQPTEAADPLFDHAPATQLHDDHVEPHLAAHDDAHADVYDPHQHEQTAYAEAAAHVEPAPVAHEPTSAIIGRYESDGTAYTMYADGSIDAQSDVGVYRFASMAELKAFIEG